MVGATAGTQPTRPPVSLVYAVTVTGILSTTLILPAIPDILDAFGQPAGRAGLLVAAGSLPGIVVAPLIGGLADRFGRRRVLVPCLALFGVAGGLGGLAPTFGFLVAARLLQGIGSAGLINLAVVIIGDHWTGEDRARTIGRNAAVLTVSLAVLPGIGGLLTEIGTWRLAFAPYLLALVTAAVVHRRLPEVDLGEPVPLRRQVHGAWQVLRRPLVAGTIANGVLVFVLIFGLYLATLPGLLQAEFGLGAGLRGLVAAVPALAATLVAFNLGRLKARWGRRRLVMASSALFCVAFLLIGAAPTLVVLFIGAALYGLAEGAAIPALQDAIVASTPAASRGVVMAIFVAGARLGQTAGPLMAGVGIAVLGPASTFLVGSGLAAALFVTQILVLPRIASVDQGDATAGVDPTSERPVPKPQGWKAGGGG
jgi:MFS family permease